MAALLQLAPVQGISFAAIARLHQAVATTLSLTAERRMAPLCRWEPHAEGCVAFRRDVALCDIPSLPTDAVFPGLSFSPHPGGASEGAGGGQG
jgi:hypothetical protein